MLVQRRYCHFLPWYIAYLLISNTSYYFRHVCFNSDFIVTVSWCKFIPVPSCCSVLVIACRTGFFVRFFVASEVKRRRSVRHARREKAQKKWSVIFSAPSPVARVPRAPFPLRSLEKREKNPLTLQAIFVCMILACGHAISRQITSSCIWVVIPVD